MPVNRTGPTLSQRLGREMRDKKVYRENTQNQFVMMKQKKKQSKKNEEMAKK